MGNILKRDFINIMSKLETVEIILLLMIRMILVFSKLFIGLKISLVYDKSMVRKDKPGISS